MGMIGNTPMTLKELIERLRENRVLFLAGEEATRQGVVPPILACLGWDRDDIQQAGARLGASRNDRDARSPESGLAEKVTSKVEFEAEQWLTPRVHLTGV